MTQPFDDNDKEPPLDAAQLRLQAKLKRMLLWSSGIMLLGLVAVFAAIFYRVYRGESKPAIAFDRPIVQSLPMPEGGRVIESRLDGNRLVVTLETAKGATVLVLDLETMQAIRRLELERKP